MQDARGKGRLGLDKWRAVFKFSACTNHFRTAKFLWRLMRPGEGFKVVSARLLVGREHILNMIMDRKHIVLSGLFNLV